MDVLGTLPVWVQLLIAFLVAGVLIVMNVGWLMQARGWMAQQKQQRRRLDAERSSGSAPASTVPPARPERDRA